MNLLKNFKTQSQESEVISETLEPKKHECDFSISNFSQKNQNFRENLVN